MKRKSLRFTSVATQKRAVPAHDSYFAYSAYFTNGIFRLC